MEPSKLISDDLLNSTPLEHHGTKGMKWGVWNAETRAKYLGGAARKISSAKTAVAKSAAKKVSEMKSSHSAKKAAKAEEKAAKKQSKADVAEQRKELGMSRARYNQLRETTLKSHDPKVVAKGMHTLTDMELDKKLDRLKKEDQIARLSSEQATRKHQEHKARSEAIKANPLYSVGMNVAGRAIKNVTKGVVDPTPGKENKSGGNDKKNTGEKEKKTGNEKPKEKKTSNEKYVDKDRVRKVVKESAVWKDQPASDRAKSAATRGERLISDGKLRAEIIDVQPVSYSSERQEKRKALPAGKE